MGPGLFCEALASLTEDNRAKIFCTKHAAVASMLLSLSSAVDFRD